MSVSSPKRFKKNDLSANAERNLAIKNRFCAAIVTSLGLAASLSVQFNMEVFMRANMAMMVHLSVTAICLVAGAGFLGSLASIPKRGEIDSRTGTIPNQENTHWRFDSSSPLHF